MGLFSSKSSSSSSQTTHNTDARVVGGEDSLNASIVGNTGPVSVTATDHGAVEASFNLGDLAVRDSLQLAGDTVNAGFRSALSGIEQGSKTAREALATSGELLTGALRQSGEQQQQALNTLQDLKSADVRVLVVVGVAAVAIVAGAFLIKAKG
jgi:hypothetical protein